MAIPSRPWQLRSKLSPGEVTGLLAEWNQGNSEALERLIPLVYRELRQLAQRAFRAERGDITLSPTALVHELYEKLAEQPNARFQDRAHFFAIAASLMRRLLVDRARRRTALRRGGDAPRVDLDVGAAAVAPTAHVDLIALDHALAELAKLDPTQARIVELRFFGGLSGDETAEVVGLSRRTVTRDWGLARAWLRGRLAETAT